MIYKIASTVPMKTFSLDNNIEKLNDYELKNETNTPAPEKLTIYDIIDEIKRCLKDEEYHRRGVSAKTIYYIEK